MNHAQHTIEFSAAQQIAQKQSEDRTAQQQKAMQEFVEENHEMTTLSDLDWWSTQTGRAVEDLIGLIADIARMKAHRLQKLTQKCVEAEFYTTQLKYNPFERRYYFYYEFAETWRPAQTWHIESELKFVADNKDIYPEFNTLPS